LPSTFQDQLHKAAYDSASPREFFRRLRDILEERCCGVLLAHNSLSNNRGRTAAVLILYHRERSILSIESRETSLTLEEIAFALRGNSQSLSDAQRVMINLITATYHQTKYGGSKATISEIRHARYQPRSVTLSKSEGN